MTGGELLGLMLLSMAWLFFLLGTLFNVAELLRAFRNRKPAVPPLPLLPGVVGSLAAFFSTWPWFWIVLPLVVEVVAMAAARALRRYGKNP